jgi:hypothetical protein
MRKIQTLDERMDAARVFDRYRDIGTNLSDPSGQMFRIIARCLHDNAYFRLGKLFLNPMKNLFHLFLFAFE